MIVVEKERKKEIYKKERELKEVPRISFAEFFQATLLWFSRRCPTSNVVSTASDYNHYFLKTFFFSLKIVAKKLNTSKKFKYFLSLCLWTFLTLAEPVSIRAHK